MAVDDHGLETLKKSAEDISGNKTDYAHKVIPLNIFGPPKNAVGFTINQGLDFDIYEYRDAYPSGNIVRQVKIYYTNSCKDEIIGAEIL